MNRIQTWKSFNEAQSYPDPIEFYVNLVTQKCLELFDGYLSSDEESLQEVFTISYSQILPHIQSSPDEFKRFPVETLEVSLNLVEGDSSFYKGVSKQILTDQNHAYRNQLSYLKKSKSKLVDESIFYRISLAVGVDKQDETDIQKSKRVLKHVINHEIQHGFDNYNSIIKGVDMKSDYIFYNTIQLISEQLSNHLDWEENPTLPLLLISIYNCSESEIKSAVAEPGKSISSIEEWQEIISKRMMDYDYSNLLQDLKQDKDYEVYEAIPQLIKQQYLEICEANDITPSQRLLKVCDLDFESFVNYWIKNIERSIDRIKRKSAKRIQISK
jgi:hypothetical protein